MDQETRGDQIYRDFPAAADQSPLAVEMMSI